MGEGKKRLVVGRNVLLHTIGKKGRLVEEKMQNDDKIIIQKDIDTEDISFSEGRTISLKNYEFARVSMGLKVGLEVGKTKEERDIIYNKLIMAVREILDREEAYIRGQEYCKEKIDLKDVGLKVSVWLDYGMTFKGNGMDSHKIDISMSRYLPDDSDFEIQIEKIENEIGNRIGEERNKVLNSNDSDIII